jgi:hypothetical protein
MEHEQAFWGDCSNTFGEEWKQVLYADLMGLKRFGDGRSPFNFWGHGLSWIDFGGGPASLLLKMKGAEALTVVDPLPLPLWAVERYEASGLDYLRQRADHPIPLFERYDIGLCYNVLQHVEDPDTFVANLRSLSKVQVVFEWINLPPHDGHPNMLTEASLDAWFGPGFTGTLEGQHECWGEFWCKPLTAEDLVTLTAQPLTAEAIQEHSFPNG